MKANIILPTIVMLFFSLIGGVAIALNPTFGSAMLLVPIVLIYIGLFIYLKSMQPVSDYQGLVFCLISTPLVLIPVLSKYLGFSLFGGWQVVLIGLSVLGVSSFWEHIKSNIYLKIWLVFIFLFLGWGLISALFGKTNFLALVYQVISNLKCVLLVVLGFALKENKKNIDWLLFGVRWLWLPHLVLVLMQWFLPEVYVSLFSPAYPALTQDPAGIFPSRAMGALEHPGFLAAISAALCILSFSLIRLDKKKYTLLCAAYFFLLLASCQRQELFACVAALAVGYVLFYPKGVTNRLLVVLPVVGLCILILFMLFQDSILRELGLWGLEGGRQIEHPRAQLFAAAVKIADMYFPLGSGFGSFAGAGAEKFNTALYDYMGFGRYWWYGKENFLMDTYWPNSIAETGFIGFSFLFLSYIVLIVLSVRLSSIEMRDEGVISCFRIYPVMFSIYMILISFSSPAYQDPRLYIFSAVFLGWTMNLARIRK